MPFTGRFASRLGNGGDDGEHGPFDGIRHRLVGVLPCQIAGTSEVVALTVGLPIEPLGEPLEELREDDAAVPASTHERAGVEGGCHFGHGRSGQTPQIVNTALHGEVHIRAGVAVGHGENVEALMGSMLRCRAAAAAVNMATRSAPSRRPLVSVAVGLLPVAVMGPSILVYYRRREADADGSRPISATSIVKP